jgi:hypothetical protein
MRYPMCRMREQALISGLETGGSSTLSRFNLTMDPTNDLPALSSCTTCRFVEDKSNYWTAVMYFKNRNGSFIRVR